MNIHLDVHMRSHENCGSTNILRVRSNLPQIVPNWSLATNKGHQFFRNRATLYVGEVGASRVPLVLDTLLGSCVAVCMYDPVLKVGGMNHILLPDCRAGERNPRRGIDAMELLVNELVKLGGDRRRFVAKAFGGANVLESITRLPIGDGNAKFVRDFLAADKIPLIAERMGGTQAVHLYFRTDTGKATVQTIDGSMLPEILDEERRS